jgi:hypothetical protein
MTATMVSLIDGDVLWNLERPKPGPGMFLFNWLRGSIERHLLVVGVLRIEPE